VVPKHPPNAGIVRVSRKRFSGCLGNEEFFCSQDFPVLLATETSIETYADGGLILRTACALSVIETIRQLLPFGRIHSPGGATVIKVFPP